MKKTKRGFTLIEVLIVIVILAVLASLVLPRMMAQPERAKVAEAVNYLGVIRRAQDSIVGSTEGNWIAANVNDTTGVGGDAGWKTIGLGSLPATSSFYYSCTAGVYNSAGAAANAAGTCTATRRDGTKANGTITMRLYSGTITACTNYVLTGTAGAVGTTCG